MSHQIILGTAGHIDHGKTTLIKALTGINTDRLKEEQRRGITIELGFAAFDLPGGRHVGIVDVPGHEKFVKNMVAGATGIDIVAMVIAADEGVMPQTREHMEICALLGVRHGLVVLTKVDLVDEEWLELVMEDIRDFVQGTFLEDRPIVPVSSVTGRGMDDFVAALEQLSREVPERSSSGIFRLPVDRVFTMRGFGTVITGTLISGRVSVGETVMLYPSGITAKVRGIQVHNQAAEAAEAGMRTAVNFQGLEKTVVNRGDILSTPAALAASYMVDVMFHYLKSNRKPIKNRTRVRFHTGTSEVLGNLILLDTEELVPGESAPAQLRLETPVALVKDDRFVARSYSPVRTVGGGKVLNPIPVKHKRFDDGVVGMLRDLDQHESGDVICRLTAAGVSRGLFCKPEGDDEHSGEAAPPEGTGVSVRQDPCPGRQ
ncbi:MAG: selenocysteine-specific translation elongation factor, partial [Desulfococcus multivorans]|nr:selenocysteine-specific translation elongation factor [Desulfococcus multivorans]